MRDAVLGLCILSAMLLGYFLAENDLDQWMHWPIYLSFLALVALAVTPLKWQSPQSETDGPKPFSIFEKWANKIPEPVKKSFSIFLAILFGGFLAWLATKLGVPIPSIE